VQAGHLGLTLAEAKSLLARLQTATVMQQTSGWIAQHGHCLDCGAPLRRNGQHAIVLRTVFGKLNIASPRFYRCCCAGRGRASFSPLADFLCERTAPELRYLQTKWAPLMSYGMTVGLLKDVVPVSDDLSVTAIRKDVERAAQRLDCELGDERSAAQHSTGSNYRIPPDHWSSASTVAMSTHAIKNAARAGSKSSSVRAFPPQAIPSPATICRLARS